MFWKIAETFGLIIITYLDLSSGHGRLLDPPSRSSMWRYGFPNPPNYDDNQVYCGGVQVQWEQNGGKCGVCGDPWQGPRDNEPGGKFANGIIVRKYTPGEVITVVVELTANHKGYMEFRLCPNDDPRKVIQQDCLDRYPLRLTENGKTRFMVPPDVGYQKFNINLALPANVVCRACVFQWKYNAGNSWGTDPKTGQSCVGCGRQEQFYGCADVAIGYDDIEIGKHKTLQGDVKDVENDKKIQKPDTDPGVEDHQHLYPNPVLPGFSDSQIMNNNDNFRFMSVQNGGTMSSCLCVCKKSLIHLYGGASMDLKLKMFEGDNDSQMCMCMCQNNSSSRRNPGSLTFLAPVIVLLFTYILRRR
ncbi:hypothetical protein CHS0354_019055 [Potamilus streckersoni]|uniref:Chitin-binding type-4 domain-containing protein n=1 Tax=Potamilus streckersoni TaxID=2493646 RepID=A0AAE0SJ19_9BIVA|nr:hypothetical protein CHS0354_019055 [Potamilus streckersoni]